MPLTRKSFEPLVRTTRSQGSPALKSPAGKSPVIQKQGSPRVDPKEKVNRKAEQAKKSGLEVAGSPQRKGRNLKPTQDADEEAEASTREAGGERGRKRRADVLEPWSSKKLKPSTAGVSVAKPSTAGISVVKPSNPGVSVVKPSPASVAVIKTEPGEVVSPRRSSRAVVPNSRFKDMELLEPLKRHKKTEPSPTAKPKEKSRDTGRKRKTTQPAEHSITKGMHIQPAEAEVVTEEIITDETPIDAQAQQNMFDEVPAPSESSVEPTQQTPAIAATSEHNTAETEVDNLKEETTEAKSSDEKKEMGGRLVLKKKSSMNLLEVRPFSDAWNERYGCGVVGQQALSTTRNENVELEKEKTFNKEEEETTKNPDIPSVIVQCEGKIFNRPRKMLVTPTHTPQNKVKKTQVSEIHTTQEKVNEQLVTTIHTTQKKVDTMTGNRNAKTVKQAETKESNILVKSTRQTEQKSVNTAEKAEKVSSGVLNVTKVHNKELLYSFLNPKPDSSVDKSGDSTQTPGTENLEDKGKLTKQIAETIVQNVKLDNKANPAAPKLNIDIIKMTRNDAVSLLSPELLHQLEDKTLSKEEAAYSAEEENDDREVVKGEPETEEVTSGFQNCVNDAKMTGTGEAMGEAICDKEGPGDKQTLQPEIHIAAEVETIPDNLSEAAKDHADTAQIGEVDELEDSLREDSKHDEIKIEDSEVADAEYNNEDSNFEDRQTEEGNEPEQKEDEENQYDKMEHGINELEGGLKEDNKQQYGETEESGKEICLKEESIIEDANTGDNIIKVTVIEDAEHNIIEYTTIEANNMVVSTIEANNLDNSTIEENNIEGGTVEDSSMVDSNIQNNTMENKTMEGNNMENNNMENSNLENDTMEHSNMESNNMENNPMESSMERNTMESSNIEESKKLSDEKSAASLCQVITLEQSRGETQRQTAIEYVMFGDKMVPIHKPLTPHGRISTQKPAVPARKRPGRVEVGGVGVSSSGMMKKIPLTAAQTVINQVLEQIGDNKELSPMVIDTDELALDTADTAAQQVTASGDEEKSAELEKRVVHGYIERSSDSGGTIEPTQIVEISQDLFAKEVYGETDMAVDPVAGEILGEMATPAPVQLEGTDNNVAVATTLSSETTEKVSLAGAEPSEQNEQGEQGASGLESGHEVSSLPLEAARETDTNPVKCEDQSADYDDKDAEQPGQCVEIVNVSISAESLLQCSEELPMSVSTMDFITAGQSKPTVVDLGVIESDYPTPASTVDPKVTTHYNDDGSMIIRIEGTNSAAPKRVSSVTVPHIIRVKSKQPSATVPVQQQKTPSYITIPAWKPENQSNQSQAQTQNVAYKKLSDVKINPAVGVKQVASYVKREPRILAPSAGRRQVVTSTSTQTRTESETQTENTDEELEEEDDEDEEEEEGIAINEVVVSSKEKNLVKTRMSIQEDGQLQEYVVVGLPEGTEIKQSQARQAIKDPVHDEIVTMGEDGMYVCVDCNHKTDKKSNWYKHRRKHLGIRPHACTRCNYKAATSSNLKRHMQIHDDIRNFVCSVCSLMFRQKIHLERHIKYKHQEKKVKCPLCDYLCSSENPDLKIHIRRRHMPYEGGSMGAFTCTECGLMTVSKKDLKQHMKFHKKGPELKLFCEFCSFVTDCESRLRRHMLIHTKERPFQCGLCEYRASQKEHVLRHMRSQHDVEVERRPRRSLLTENSEDKVGGQGRGRRLAEGVAPDYMEEEETQDSTEEGDKPFEKSDYSSTDKIFACNHCSMKFSKLINLYKHLYVQHKQVMPEPGLPSFQCVVCEFATNNKKNLLVHMRKHNMQDHTPPSHVYSCVLCRYMNPRRRNLFQHMKKKHGIEIVMKEDGSNCYVTTDNSSVVFGTQTGNEPNVIALSDIVTTESIDDETQLQIVTEDGSTFQGGKISIENIISVEEMAAYVSASQEQGSETTTSEVATSEIAHSEAASSMYQTVAGHEAAEAIEGLQALAQQPGVLETQTVDNDITAEIVTTTEILSGDDHTGVMVGMEGEGSLLAEGVQVEEDAGGAGPGIELSSEQINQLSTGDYVEINGEVYKVEIAQQEHAVKL